MKSKIFNFKLCLGAVCILFFAAGFISCEKNVIDPIVIDPGVQISFQNDVKPILDSKCKSCHNGYKFSPTYQSIVDAGYINTANPESSILYDFGFMDASHIARSNDVEKQKVLLWIQQGALNN